jgi:hypothetical protein
MGSMQKGDSKSSEQPLDHESRKLAEHSALHSSSDTLKDSLNPCSQCVFAVAEEPIERRDKRGKAFGRGIQILN